jgi:diketogulonate reductase-like aldo/keto reductase
MVEIVETGALLQQNNVSRSLSVGMHYTQYMDIPAALDDQGNRERSIQSLKNPRGRMDTRGWGGTLYRYRTDAAMTAMREYAQIARKYKISLTELSLRWCRQRTLLTTTLVGHSNRKQLQESLRYFANDTPLSEDIMWEVDMVHMKNRLPLFSSNRVGSDWFQEGEIGETIP